MNTSKTIEKIKSLFEKDAAEKLPHNIPLLLRARAEAYPDYTLQIVKNEVGEYEHYSYKRVYNRVVETACALQKIGVTRGAFIGLMCDNRFYIKPTEAGRKLLRTEQLQPPYKGAKNYFYIEELDDHEYIAALVRSTCKELPEPKPKKRKKT